MTRVHYDTTVRRPPASNLLTHFLRSLLASAMPGLVIAVVVQVLVWKEWDVNLAGVLWRFMA